MLGTWVTLFYMQERNYGPTKIGQLPGRGRSLPSQDLDVVSSIFYFLFTFFGGQFPANK